jgi:hypothetical protein
VTRAPARSFATFWLAAAAAGASGVFGGCFDHPYPTCKDDQCIGNAHMVCVDDVHAPEREECGPSRHCVEGTRSYGYYAACALRGTDQRCNPETDDDFCDGQKVVTCRGAYPTAEFDCASQGLLCASDFHNAACVEAGTPDPRCDDGDKTRLSFCDGQDTIACLGHFVYGRSEHCGSFGSGPCVDFPRTDDYPAHAECVPPAKPP